MRIETLILSDGAGLENGLLNVIHGGWERYNVEFYPATITGAIGGILIVDDVELSGELPVVTFSVEDEDGHLRPAAGAFVVPTSRPPAPGKAPARVPFAVGFSCSAERATDAVHVKLTASDGTVLGDYVFAIVDHTPDTPEGLG